MKRFSTKLFKNPVFYGLLFILVLSLVIPSPQYGLEGFTSDSKCELTPEQFTKESKDNTLFTLFYAPWCGHCTKMKPEWESAASQVNKDGCKKMVMVNVGDQDNKAQEQLRKKYEILGYPTILDIDKGSKVSDYDGSRDTNSLVKHANSL